MRKIVRTFVECVYVSSIDRSRSTSFIVASYYCHSHRVYQRQLF